MVVEAIEGTCIFNTVLAPDGECNRGAMGICCYRKAFADITETVRKKLDSYNFADLIEESDCKDIKDEAISQ